jgi:hypothetical protein
MHRPLYGSTVEDSRFALRAPTGLQQVHWRPLQAGKFGSPITHSLPNTRFHQPTAHWIAFQLKNHWTSWAIPLVEI